MWYVDENGRGRILRRGDKTVGKVLEDWKKETQVHADEKWFILMENGTRCRICKSFERPTVNPFFNSHTRLSAQLDPQTLRH